MQCKPMVSTIMVMSLWGFLQAFIEMVRNKTGLETTSIASIWSVYDTLFCEVSFTWHIIHFFSDFI